MSLFERAKEFEDMPDSQIAQIAQQGGEQSADVLLAATETQRRKDVRDRYQAQLEKHQAQQQAQQGPDDIISQRVRELTERGGGITGVDPGMPLEDPRLQQGIATPPDVQALQRAYGGLIPGYHEGDLIPPDHKHDPKTGRELGPDGRPLLTHELEQRAGISHFPKSEQNLISRMIQDAPEFLGTVATTAPYSEAGMRIPMSERRAEYQERKDLEEGGAGATVGAEGVDEFGRAIGPDGRPTANVGDDYEYDNRADLMKMFSRAKAKFDETGDPIYRQEMESIAAGLENLTSGPTAMKRRAQESGLTLEDFIASMEQSEGDKTRAHQMGLLERGLTTLDDLEDLFTTRTDADKAHREAAGRAEDAILADARGIHSLKKGQMGELEDYRQRRQGTVDTIDEDLRELREYQREVGRLGADAAFMHVGTGVGDEWRGVVGNKLDAQRTENLANELTMLTKLHANMKEGDTFEGLDQQAIYDLALEKQTELDKAEQDRTDFDVQNLYEDANRKRDIAKDLIDERMGLFGHGIREEGANQRAARAAQADMVRAQLASKTQGENFLANPENWPHIELMYDEVIERLDPITHGDRIEELKKELEMVSEYMTGLQTQTAVTGGLPTTRETGSRSLTFSGLPQDLSIMQMAPRSAQ